jgi:hypothetical protein
MLQLRITAQPRIMAPSRITAQPITIQALEFPLPTALTIHRGAIQAETVDLRSICIGLS